MKRGGERAGQPDRPQAQRRGEQDELFERVAEGELGVLLALALRADVGFGAQDNRAGKPVFLPVEDAEGDGYPKGVGVAGDEAFQLGDRFGRDRLVGEGAHALARFDCGGVHRFDPSCERAVRVAFPRG